MAVIAGWLLCNGHEVFVALPGWHLPSHPAPKSWRCTWRFCSHHNRHDRRPAETASRLMERLAHSLRRAARSRASKPRSRRA
jgi:hypothetical protein